MDKFIDSYSYLDCGTARKKTITPSWMKNFKKVFEAVIILNVLNY